MTDHDTASDPDYSRRFGWGMRLLIGALVFDMVFRTMYWTVAEWGVVSADVRHAPMALPSREELAAIDAGTHPEGYESRGERYTASMRSVAEFAVTGERPREATTWAEAGPRWLMTRLVFIGHLTGMDQTWQMFASASRARWMMHVQLRFADGSTQVFYGRSHPRDLTRAAHSFEEKRLQAELNSLSRPGAMLGYSHWLAHRYKKNAAGARLATIEFSHFYLQRAPPGEDPRDNLRRQSDRPQRQIGPVYWIYDVGTGTGQLVETKP